MWRPIERIVPRRTSRLWRSPTRYHRPRFHHSFRSVELHDPQRLGWFAAHSGILVISPTSLSAAHSLPTMPPECRPGGQEALNEFRARIYRALPAAPASAVRSAHPTTHPEFVPMEFRNSVPPILFDGGRDGQHLNLRPPSSLNGPQLYQVSSDATNLNSYQTLHHKGNK